MTANRSQFLTKSFVTAIALAFAVLLVACSSSSDSEPTGPTGAVASPTATPSAPASPTQTPAPEPTTAAPLPTVSPVVGSPEPDGDRIMEGVKALADEIGPRVAGTDSERIAAELIGRWLTDMGYEVELQEFPIGSEIGRSSSLTIEGADSQTVPTLPFGNSGARSVSGRLVNAGDGRPGDFPPDTAGAIALVRRDGVVFFNEKVANAVAAGATGVIVYNNAPGILLGSLEIVASVPVVGISMAEGQDLVAALADGPVSVDLSVGSLSNSTSLNVLARPPGGECETLTGGHYDSVQLGTGASDNASGTAAVLEIAAVLAHDGVIGPNCFALFGAEELGLLGSRYYVSQLSPPERDRIKAFLNFDMVGVGDEAWWLIGTAALQDQMADLAEGLDIADVRASELIRGLSSDHASFIQAGIPALMFHRWEDPLLHTPEDVTERVKPQYLEEAARMGIALLEALTS